MGTEGDGELLERWGQGDQTAGRQLFERHFDALYRFYCNKVNDGVEDLVQQTFLACIEGRARFRREASFRTYMFQTARHLLYAHYRTLQRKGQPDFEVQSVADMGTSPSGLLGREQEERCLLEALRSVSLQHQLILELYFWEDLSGPEIAEILEVPEPTVRSRIRLATERLRAQMIALADGDARLRDTADDLDAWARRMRKVLEGSVAERKPTSG
jgi:RNA polymerase sigma-70 factor (ECF subfamily)